MMRFHNSILLLAFAVGFVAGQWEAFGVPAGLSPRYFEERRQVGGICRADEHSCKIMILSIVIPRLRSSCNSM